MSERVSIREQCQDLYDETVRRFHWAQVIGSEPDVKAMRTELRDLQGRLRSFRLDPNGTKLECEAFVRHLQAAIAATEARIDYVDAVWDWVFQPHDEQLTNRMQDALEVAEEAEQREIDAGRDWEHCRRQAWIEVVIRNVAQ